MIFDKPREVKNGWKNESKVNQKRMLKILKIISTLERLKIIILNIVALSNEYTNNNSVRHK